jgi:hypothetical protein
MHSSSCVVFLYDHFHVHTLCACYHLEKYCICPCVFIDMMLIVEKLHFVTCFVQLKMSFANIVVSKIVTNKILNRIKQVAKTYFSTIVWCNIYPCMFVDAMNAWKKLDSNFMNGLTVHTLKNTKSLVDGGSLAWPIFEQ